MSAPQHPAKGAVALWTPNDTRLNVTLISATRLLGRAETPISNRKASENGPSSDVSKRSGHMLGPGVPRSEIGEFGFPSRQASEGWGSSERPARLYT